MVFLSSLFACAPCTYEEEEVASFDPPTDRCGRTRTKERDVSELMRSEEELQMRTATERPTVDMETIDSYFDKTRRE